MHVLMLVPDCYMIDRRVLQQARTLVRAGARVTLLAGFECPRSEEYDEDGVHIVRSQYDWDDQRLQRLRAKLPDNDRLKMLVNRVFMKGVVRFLRLKPFDTFVLAQAERFTADVVHVHDLPVLKHGLLLARRWRVPLVFDAHEIYYEQECIPPRVRRRQRREERRAIPRLSLFITVNDAIADHYHQRYGVRPLVLMNCADPPPPGFDAGSREELRRLAGLPPEAHVVLYQGWISAERNLTTLVRAAEHLPDDTFLVIIGYGDHEKDLRAILQNAPWRDRVRLLGRVEPDRILSLTAGADVGVIPYQPIDLNHTLCSPNKFFEYVQSGVPVVAHDLVFFRAMRDRFGVVEVGDLATPESTATMIRAVVGDTAKRARMREACRVAGLTLNWDVESRKLIRAYEKMMGQTLETSTRLDSASAMAAR
jgi:glycosyltransferase involved in cell wall biosynthesis